MTWGGGFGTRQQRTANKILKLENEVLDAMISIRYAVEQGEPIDPEWLVVLRGSSEAIAETTEKFEAWRKEEEAKEYSDD